MIKKLYYTSVLILGAFPVMTLAQPTGPRPTATSSLRNPLSIDTIQGLLTTLLEIVVIIATPIIVFFVIYSGFLYVTAQGNPAKIQEATRSLTYAVIGAVLVVGASAIALIVKNLVAGFTN